MWVKHNVRRDAATNHPALAATQELDRDNTDDNTADDGHALDVHSAGVSGEESGNRTLSTLGDGRGCRLRLEFSNAGCELLAGSGKLGLKVDDAGVSHNSSLRHLACSPLLRDSGLLHMICR